jgi:hypothetical protein
MPLHPLREGAFLFSNSNLLEHPLYGMIRSEPMIGSVSFDRETEATECLDSHIQ